MQPPAAENKVFVKKDFVNAISACCGGLNLFRTQDSR